MIKVTTSGTIQTFYLIPSSFDNIDNIVVTDDITGQDVGIVSETFTREGDYIKCEIQFGAGSAELINNRFYTLNLRNNVDKSVYKDKLICTDDYNSTTQDWDINEGEYTEHQTPNNDYIVI